MIEMKLKLGAKLGLGFGVILLLMIVSALLAYVRSTETRRIETNIVALKVPSIQASRRLQDDIDYAASKTRQAILAGSQPARSQDSQQRFDDAWNRIDRELTSLTTLSPSWSQEDRDRLSALKDQLPNAKKAQWATVETARSGGHDAIVQAGNDYADKIVAALDGVTKNLGQLADGFDRTLKDDQQELASANRAMNWTMSLAVLAGLTVGVFVAISLSRDISISTKLVLDRAEEIAAGDLAHEEIQTRSHDELADLTRAVNKMHASLRKMVVSIGANAQQVATSSEEFSAVSQQISSNSEETTAQANVVSAATEMVNRNLQTVATGAEEMRITIQDISKNATEAARVAGQAVKTAQAANGTISQLGDSSEEIGKVIKVITSIAEQTNLLALNATIEAARAGEAGKGFAVVATEVKELAKQTAKATEDISFKIKANREATTSAVEAIKGIGAVINHISDISNTIATAVAEQSATTEEMSRNVNEAAKGAGEIAENIKGVAQAAQGTSGSANDSLKAAQDLAQMSTALRGLVEQFSVGESHNGANSYAASRN
jgi:methyl-accepting chemotaxis protein